MQNLDILADFLLVGGMTLTGILIFITLKSKKTFSKHLLAVFLGVSFFFLLYYYAFLHKASILASISVLFAYGMGFLIGPVLYIYVKSLAFSASKLKPQLAKLLIPYFVYWSLFSLPLALNIFDRENFTVYGQWVSDTSDYFNIVENLYFIFFAFASLRLLSRLDHWVKCQYADLTSKNLSWCRRLIIGLITILVFDIFLSFYELAFPPTEVVWNVGLFVAFTLIVLLLYIGYMGLFQAQIFVHAFLMEEKILLPKPTQEQGVGYTGLPTQLAQEMKQRVEDALVKDKLYTNEDLTLTDLANAIDSSDKKLSILLNHHMNTNFYELVNTYRVEAVKEMMSRAEFNHYTLISIGLEAGFKSKTSFNRVFKAKSGMTPSQFKKSMTGNPMVKARV